MITKDDNRNKLWLVEYIACREEYRISRFAEPDQTVAYEEISRAIMVLMA